MSDRPLECGKCGRDMEPGYLLDYTHGATAQSTWVEGPPVRSIWTWMNLKGREKLKVTTWRCTKCGYLESYARDE